LYRDGPGVAVASGAVLRALNKKCGPERIIRSSYGIVCKEIYDDSLPGHIAAAKSELDIDGEEYIKNSIVWLITKVSIGLKKITIPSTWLTVGEQGETMNAQKSQFRLPMQKIIGRKPGESFVCTETLYVSDVCTESNYQKHHPKNKGT